MAPGILTNPPLQEYSFTQKGANTRVSEQVQQWPRAFATELAWNASAFESEQDYTTEITQSDNEDIATGLAAFLALELDGHEINSQNFPLPTLEQKLRQCSLQIHSGRGFVNIRGINYEKYTLEEGVLVFLGISSYIAEMRAKQDSQGNMLMHIRDAKSSSISQEDRPTRFSNRASTFHTDPFPDILGLQTKTCAAKGGNHVISSSLAIYNTLAATRPDVLETLAQPNWPFDSAGELIQQTTRPILFYHGGHIIFNYAREPLIGLSDIPRSSVLPSLTEVQREALDVLEAVAQANQLVLENKPGDLTFINNYALLHSRKGFEDEADRSRYLVRLWLKNKSLAWKMPRVLREGNERLFESNEVEEYWNIVPLPKLTFTVAERLSS